MRRCVFSTPKGALLLLATRQEGERREKAAGGQGHLAAELHPAPSHTLLNPQAHLRHNLNRRLAALFVPATPDKAEGAEAKHLAAIEGSSRAARQADG